MSSPVLAVVAIEIVVRCLPAPPPASYVRQSYMKIAATYPLRDQVLRDMGGARYEYRDYYLFSPEPWSSTTINFTGYYGARATPASTPTAREIVWLFGGSTLQNLEVDDALTIANQTALAMGRPVRVHNFAVGAFQSTLELIKFQELLRLVPAAERPTTVLFYDGFNESRHAYYFGAGRPQADVSSKLGDVVNRRHLRMLVHAGSETAATFAATWRRFGRSWLERRLHPLRIPDGGAANLRAAAEIYRGNVQMTRGICAALAIRCLFVLQPLLITRSPLTPLEQEALAALAPEEVRFGRAFYGMVGELLAGEPGFHDLSRVANGIAEPVFYDYGHTSPLAGPMLGQALATLLR